MTSATSRRGRAMRPRSGGRRSARDVEAQSLQGARDVADRVDGDAGLERGRLQLGVSEQHLDHANIDVLFEQMRGEAVPQRMTASISSPLLFQTIGSPHTRAGSGTNPTASFSTCSYDETFP